MKKTLLIAVLGVAVVLLIMLASFIAINNEIVSLQEGYKSQWAQVDTVLQRRYDLIPNLVETVKGYAAHEKEVFESVAAARSQWAAAKSPEDKARAASVLESGIGRLIAVAESYPELKASANFKDLQYELAGTENRISVERQRYNDALRAYNTKVRQFPASFVAGMRGFTASDAYFNAGEAPREAPKVDFGASPKTT